MLMFGVKSNTFFSTEQRAAGSVFLVPEKFLSYSTQLTERSPGNQPPEEGGGVDRVTLCCTHSFQQDSYTSCLLTAHVLSRLKTFNFFPQPNTQSKDKPA